MLSVFPGQVKEQRKRKWKAERLEEIMINIYIMGISAILIRTDPRTQHLYYKCHDKFHWCIISCGIVIYLIYPKYVHKKLHFSGVTIFALGKNNKYEMIEKNKISPKLMVPKVWMRITLL